MQKIEEEIRKSIKSRPMGVIITPNSFSSIGNSTAIRKSLQRINESGLIKKVSHGIYYRPIFNEYIGELTPSIDDIVKQIAKRDCVKIIPTGNYALYALGLTTQIPMNYIYITDGSARTLKIQNQTIVFKKVSPKNFMLKDEITILIVQAFKELKKENISDEILDKIGSILQKSKPIHLKKDLLLVPVWIKELIQKIYNE